MPTIKEIKELLSKVIGLTQSKKSKPSNARPSPLPPMSPFTHVRDIVRERDADNKVPPKTVKLSDEVVKNIQRAGY
tara:strand:+ start:917 stop:1144 length:228 start_codon:yes stop_codon:yes gene_type:complete